MKQETTPFGAAVLTRSIALVAALVACLAVVLVAAGGARAASPSWEVLSYSMPTHLSPKSEGGTPGTGQLVVFPVNKGGLTTSAGYTVDIDLPAGIVTSGEIPNGGTTCTPGGAGHSSVSCNVSVAVPAQSAGLAIVVPVRVDTTEVGGLSAHVTLSGGGAGTVEEDVELTVDPVPAGPGMNVAWAGAFDEDGAPYTQAGGHPESAMAAFYLNTAMTPSGLKAIPPETPRDLIIDAPPGFVVNPLATPRCAPPDPTCEVAESPRDTVVGHVSAQLTELRSGDGPGPVSGLFNGVPPKGSAAQFTFTAVFTMVPTLGKLRPDDFGGRAITPRIHDQFRVFGAVATLWGEPGDASHDSRRCGNPVPTCALPNPGAVTDAFLTNPTECSGSVLSTMFSLDTWQNIGVFTDPVASDSPAVTGCALVPFDPGVTTAATSSTADSPSGFDFDLTMPQEGLLDPNAIAQSHLEDVTVELPEGVAVNPSGATGLQACSDEQMQVGEQSPPACPDASKIGTVEVTSPLADHPIDGTLYLGSPKSTDPMSGDMFRLFVVARDDQLGVMVKLPGSATADPQTGRLVATFENNPRVPFDHLSVKLKRGDKGLLATPQTCGDRSIDTTLSPWSGNTPVTGPSPLETSAGCGFGFAPKLAAGNSNNKARGSGTFSFKFSREDGEQWVDGLTASLPPGLLASVKDLPLCGDAQASAGACPDGSRIGTVDATAGSGDPFVLEQKGSVYLTEGYKGCAYGLAVVVPVVAGPFDGSSPETDLGDVIVRQKVCVDPTSAQVTAVSDPLPTIWHGVPLRVRSVTVNVDRPGFMLNPSDCDPTQVGALFDSANDATSTTSSPFQVAGCAGLPFKPTLALSLTGRRQVTTGKHPGIKALVTQQGVGEAGIEQAVVRLPKSLALDPDNAQALCEFEDGTKPDLENHCPAGSIVGRARAVTPLLNQPLTGNVYFVKNVRKDPTTGNLIRTLPMIIVALRGEIAVNLKGESSTTKSGKLVNTFANVPDAPISQFNLNIQGGKTGILAVTRTRKAKINLCTGRHTAETDMDAQNGRRHDFDIRMKTPCTKKQTKAAKRQAKRAAAKAKHS